MAAIVKANANVTAGGLAVLKRSFQTTARGQVTYSADYVCLSQFASVHSPLFRSNSVPPTPILPEMLLLNLTRTPTLESLETTVEHGLTYFRATYTAGVETDLVFTTTTEQRSITWRWIDRNSGEATINSFDYMSVSVTVTGTNTTIPVVAGSVGRIFNTRGITESELRQNTRTEIRQRTLESYRQVRNANGEYENSATSTGIFEAEDVYYGFEPMPTTPPSTGSDISPVTSVFPNRDAYDPTSLTGRTGGTIDWPGAF